MIKRIQEKIKKFFSNKVFVFILGGILFSAVSVYAVTYFPSNQVTYDNKTSKLNSTNVQGAIDELYNTCSKMASSGKYLYYVITSYNSGSGEVTDATLYRCNVDGSSCNSIKSTRWDDISSIYVSADYLYYVITSYNSGSGEVTDATLYRCNVDGSSCNSIKSTRWDGISSIYVSADYLYYVITSYSSGSANGATLYRCNVDGSSCSSMESTNYANISIQ